MKRLSSIFFALALILGFAACSDSGSTEPAEDTLTLNPDKTSILANGTDKVTFQVRLGNTDVTETAQIYLVGRNGESVSELQSSAQFASQDAGSYVFEARYNNNGIEMQSGQKTISVNEDNPEEIFFYRKIFAQYCTSIGCHNCPQMNTALKSLDQDYKDRLVIATFHTNFSGITDPMTTELTLQYMINILFQQGLPACYLDLRADMSCYTPTPVQTTISNIDNVLAQYPATCGVKIDSQYDASAGRVTVTFTVKASVTKEYRILPFLVEDGIVYPQSSGNIMDNTYVHDNTVRMGLASQLIGDRLNTIEKNAEQTKRYSFRVDSDWNVENLRLVVCVLSSDDGTNFYGNNAATCGINESIDYAYNE